jgi:hypothetical protein
VWIAETINMMKASQQKAAISLVVGAIGFKIIIDIPALYYSALNSPIKSKVGKLKARRPRKSQRDETNSMRMQGLYNLVYLCSKWFFTSCYYYFYSFIVISVPFARVLLQR